MTGSGRLRRGARRLLAGSPDDLGGTIYGTIVVLAVIAAAGSPKKVDASELAEVAILTTTVLWAAHVYAHGLAASVKLGRRLDGEELRLVAAQEAAIPLAAVAPSFVLILGALELIRESRAIWLALGLGIATLGIAGLRYARLEGLGTGWTVVVIGTNLAIGAGLVALKIAVAH